MPPDGAVTTPRNAKGALRTGPSLTARLGNMVAAQRACDCDHTSSSEVGDSPARRLTALPLPLIPDERAKYRLWMYACDFKA